jgi:hypothetical protein
MNHLRYSAASIALFGIMLSACTEKPSFDTPAVIIDRPVVRTETGTVLNLSFFSSSSSVPAEPNMIAAEPESLLIQVPFAPQAPFAVWDPLHEEACEEMALIMVRHFLHGSSLSLQEAETEVQALVAWETENGYGYDVSAKELGDIASAFYGLRYRVLTNVTADTLRAELAAGNPVLIPAAGQTLGNPYFSGAGPLYHMLVVTGYTKDGFITNDPGTKRGEKYFYSEKILVNAIHDWTGVKEEILQGAKTALVVER